MGSFTGAFEAVLMEILSVIRPFEEDVRTRFQVINELRSVVACVESLRGATVEPFGSFISNLYTRWGDLDISIELPSDSFIASVGKKRKQNLLRDLMIALRKRGIAHNIQYISNARVPLLIFESHHRGISCDISISNLVGQIKSKIFLWISEIDERFRDMILLVKEWAKSQNINNPKTGTLNSHSLSLLVVFHFQTCEPPILPPLQEIYAGNIAHDLRGGRTAVERDIQDKCASSIARIKTNNKRYSNESTLAELVVSFFNKFIRINAMAPDYAICTCTGKWEQRSKNSWMAKDYPLIIEDPFEQQDNAARAVGRNQLITISVAFEEISHKLSGNQERGSLITSLVRPQIRSQFAARSRGNPNVRDGDFGYRSDSTDRTIQGPYYRMPSNIHPSRDSFGQRQQLSSPNPIYKGLENMQLGSYPSTLLAPRHPISSSARPIQNQYENRRMESTPTVNVYNPQRSGKAVQGQGQQVWRPRQSER